MKIAIPTNDKKLSLHFGHCQEFAIVEVDDSTKEIVNVDYQQPPMHEPGALPRWLSEIHANVIIASGMGVRAQQLFEQANIKVVVGAQPSDPETLVKQYLSDDLQLGDNICSH